MTSDGPERGGEQTALVDVGADEGMRAIEHAHEVLAFADARLHVLHNG